MLCYVMLCHVYGSKLISSSDGGSDLALNQLYFFVKTYCNRSQFFPLQCLTREFSSSSFNFYD